MQMIDRNGHQIAVAEHMEVISNVQDALDLMATAQYYWNTGSLVMYRENLSEEFYDLKTRFAGDVLQKFSNYNVRLAIVGDFDQYNSKALRDFIYECNSGSQVFWVGSLDAALDALAPSA